MTERRIGVFICHCGGNISDYVDVAAVRDAVANLPGVAYAETAMFACSDGTQQEMVQRIEEEGLDGLVVASCSPKLHLTTFRGVSRRAGLNPFQYTQVNIREQCSWAHTDDRAAATEKATGLVRGAIARTAESDALVPRSVDTTAASLVVGGGVTGLRAAIGLADLGLDVHLVERGEELGGEVARLGRTFPDEHYGRSMVDELVAEIGERSRVTVHTSTELVAKSGSFGNYDVTLASADGTSTTARVGSIVVATGAASYEPSPGEFGFGLTGVVTLEEFTRDLESRHGRLHFRGRPVRTVAYVYCVGSRQADGNEYCSKYCCSAAVHASVEAADLDPRVRQYHLYRDVRTYGRFELSYEESRRRGSTYLRYPDDDPPRVVPTEDGRLRVTVTDLLTESTELAIEADVVVLVTGLVPRNNAELTSLLHLPVGSDGFYNEIHPKLRPVETVVDGVLIAGTCQSPKTIGESVASGMAAVTQSGAMLMRGVAELDPQVAVVDPDACTWCGACAAVCPYEAISRQELSGRPVAVVDPTGCKGCGGCVSYCESDAIDLLGNTDAQVRALIESMVEVPA